jgi:hypothetical protein
MTMTVMTKKRSRLRLAAAFLAVMLLVLGVVGWRSGVLGCMLAGGTCRSLPIENKDDLVGRLKWILIQRWFLEPLEADGNDPIFWLDDLADLYPRSVQTRPFVHEILVDPHLSLDMKELAVRVSQCLPLWTYLDFLAQIYDDWKSGRLPDDVLDTAIRPGGTWGIGLDVAYQDARVRQLLTTITQDDTVAPDTRRYITEFVLSGDGAGLVRSYDGYDGNGFTPILSCPRAPER